MFFEEEWTDSVPAQSQSPADCETETFRLKSKDISKRCFKRTLQALGSVPTWESTAASDGSDEAMVEASPVQVKKKKKKCKKRKKTQDARTEQEQHGEVCALEVPVKRRAKEKSKQPRSKTTQDRANDHAKAPQRDSSHTQADTEKLTRKQWRNKMKNKKRCYNKFLQNATGNSLTQENLGQKQVSSKDFVPINAHPPENETVKIKKKRDKKSNKTNNLQSTADEHVRKQQTNAVEKPTNPHEQCELQKAIKVDKQSQLHANKLRHILKGSVTGSSKTLTEVKQEPVSTVKEDEKSLTDRSTALRSRMEKQLESARFRHINEQLYTSTSGEAKRMFKQDPDAIRIYHKGYTEQVKRWPANPVDSIISFIHQKPASLVVADFGCGDCKIAQSVKNKVHCFDLAPACDLVTACDMANVPLADSTVDIAVFCLSLMGTNLTDFLAEANRVLVDGGVLKVAEVASRFDDIRQFIAALSRLGFKLVSKDTENTHFYSFDFIKMRNAPANVKKIGIQLKPCLYKKR